MRKTRDNDEDTNPLLLTRTNDSHQHYYPTVNSVISRGAAVHLSKWPLHLFNIFIGVCVASGAFIAFVFVTVMLSSQDIKPRCRLSRDLGIGKYQNLYFVKNSSHAWTQNQLCAIEASAREYTDFNIYLVNLLTRNLPSSPFNTSLEVNFGGAENARLSALTHKYVNVYNLTIYPETFFGDSLLREVYESFDRKLLEIAVKSELLWEHSGIALDPFQVDGITFLREYFCRPGELCRPLKNVAITSDGGIQIAPVPCHAFFELLLKKLANKAQNIEEIVKDTYKSFCPRNGKCHGVKIFTYNAENITSDLTCPLIFLSDGSQRVGRIICAFCDHWSMGNDFCVIFLGLIGTVITALDIFRMINYHLPGRSINRRRSSDVVPPSVERDLKLMTSILGIEHYTLIMLGAMTGYPMLHTPWLLMQLCVIVVEIGVFFMKLILDGLHIKLDGILLAIFTVHNWLQPRSWFLRLMCLVVSCLSSITLEVGARSPLGHSVTKSTAFSVIFRRSYNVVIKITTGRFLTSVLSTLMLTIGERYCLPFLYLPWLFNTLLGIFFYEAPTLLKWTYNQIPYVVLPATTFAFIALILFLEQLFHWCDVFASFMRTWVEYIHRKKDCTRVNDDTPNMQRRQEINESCGKRLIVFHQLVNGVTTTDLKSTRRVKSLTSLIRNDDKEKLDKCY